MSYQIITDSSCDFTKEKYEALGLIAAPLTVNFRGEPIRTAMTTA